MACLKSVKPIFFFSHHLHVKNLKHIRTLNYFAKHYDDKNDPGPLFCNRDVQTLLLDLTRVDLKKVFSKKKRGKLEEPQYAFLTDRQLKEKMNEINKKAMDLLQFPPAVAARKPKSRVFSNDPALKGLDNSKFVFTDITFGLKDSQRLIAIRDLDGSLKEADWATRDRINQVYFPKEFRQMKMPQLFKDGYFEDILNRKEYNFILDLACQQMEPDDPEYQRVVSITYQHINDNNAFDKLRSTRHFGSMVFFLVWNQIIDNLLLELIETCYLKEAEQLIQLFCLCHKQKLTTTGNMEMIEDFIKNFSNKKAVLELALQSTKEFLKQKEMVEKGIKKAHGHG